MPPQSTDQPPADDPSIAYGKLLSSPAPGDEVVISGLAGKFPDSDDVHEFRDNLFNKVDMVSGDDRRWNTNHPEIPQRTGKLRDIDLFDAGFFGIHHRQATSMDPLCRMLLERVVECIFDAGLHPSELEGSNTAVFVGTCFSENEKSWYYDNLGPQTFALTGCQRSMLANRVSYFLKLQGLSYMCDTACSSSLYALENAYKAIRSGQCDQAIVAGTNICLHPFITLQFSRLGVIGMDGACRVFDADGKGYVRAETVAAIFLQRSKDAKRIYSTVVHAKTNCDGYKDSGLTHPSGEMQMKLLDEFYQECGVNPNDLTYLEAHGTGTKVGDPEECQAIDGFFVKDRNRPLLIGSVKSNIGHTEPASGICSVAKAIIAMETGYIPPNIHYRTPREGLKAIEDGRVLVVTEKTHLPDDKGLIGINNFGFGGANCHVLLKWNPKNKVNKGQASDDLPRLVCVSGRNEEAVNTLLTDVIDNKSDSEQIRLLHGIFRKNVKGHTYRGFSVVKKEKEITRSVTYHKNKAPLYIVFSELSKADLHDFSTNTTFSNTLKRIHEVLSTKNINIYDIIFSHEITSPFDKILVTVVAQLCILEILKDLELEPTRVFGLFFSEVVAAYWNGAITLNETIECAHIIATAAKDLVQSSWLYVATEDEQTLSRILPKDVDVVADISTNAVIVSGPSENKSDFRKVLQQSGIVHYQLGLMSNFKQETFLKSRRYVADQLSKVIGSPRKLNDHDVICPDYIISCLTNVSPLIKLVQTLPTDALVMEIGDGIFYNINQVVCKTTECVITKDFNTLLFNLGRAYELGHNPQLYKLYCKVQFPVSRGTPMISPKIKWDHIRKWWVPCYKTNEHCQIGERTYGIISTDQNYTFIRGHVVDGRNLFPATGYLELVWKTLAQMKGLMVLDIRVVFENCKFKRACSVPKEGSKLELTVMVQRGSGNFEVVEGGVPVVTGRVYETNDMETMAALLPGPAKVPENVAHPMQSKDIYKELRLRGYNYKGGFRAITKCDNSCQVGLIKWDGNWITFMDNMLQMKILQEDTRSLYVPVSIKRLSINPKKHIAFANIYGENETIPVHCYRDMSVIRSGGIEITGLTASSIARRKYLGTPVLEKYQFVPNVGKMSREQSIRIQMQIALENAHGVKVKAVELRDEATVVDSEPLAPSIRDVLEDQPLIQANITVLTNEPLEIPNIEVEDRKLLTETDCMLIVGSKFLERMGVLKLALGSLREGGFVISRESLDLQNTNFPEIEVLVVHQLDNEKLVLLRKKSTRKSNTVVKVSMGDKEFKWLQKLKNEIKSDSNVIVYCQNEPLNGILGLMNCVRKEPGGQNTKCVFIVDKAPAFDPEHPFYREQLMKNMSINIYKNGQWGTYRHLVMENMEEVEVEHCYVNSLLRGDLSSLKWIEGPLKIGGEYEAETHLINVYYFALNFRDIMTASGKISVDSITRDRREQECVQGFEFSGRDESGRRVMGMTTNSAMATLLLADTYLLFEIPDSWTLQDAATVSIVYSTSIYALHVRGRAQKGDTVLIHSGTGGVGQSAIALALFYGCQVFTTVGTREKREFIKKMFPELTDRNIGNSRDTSFEQQIMKETNGRGVDIVINSLADDKLLASVRCLATGGRFIEIGKYDIAQDNQLSLLMFQKQATFHGLMLDSLFREAPNRIQLQGLLNEAIASGAVRPLQRKVFQMDQVENAFRYMATGKHMGKVLVQVREEEKEERFVPPPRTYKGMPKYFCDPLKTYVIIGGLGGFGLELADWLVLRGATNLVLTSRFGIKTGYQAYRIGIWRSYGCNVHIATQTITTKEGCYDLIVESAKLGAVHAIFNLAVILKDSTFENQSQESFELVIGPKACATQYLDEITREMCPHLRDFVVFSSVSCGRGNAGQTNYGMANSVMERICEKRRAEGYPALAIQWGAVGDVGIVAEMQEENTELEIGGTLQQKISSCLSVLDTFLRQEDASIVSSMVVAEKKSGFGGADDITASVANILGVKDLKSISMHATLAEIGMDSITAVEVKQTLEREFEIFLTAQDIKRMTFGRLQKVHEEKKVGNDESSKNERSLAGINMVARMIGDEATANIPVMKLQSKENSTLKSKILVLPGVEGVANCMDPLANNLEGEVFGMQFCNNNQADTIEGMAQLVLPHMEQRLSKSESFTIIGYSLGGVVGLEVVHLLEEKGYYGTYMCIDGAPAMLKGMTKMLKVESEDQFQTAFIIHIMSLFTSYNIIDEHAEAIFKCNSLEERIKVAQKMLGASSKHTPEYQRDCAISVYKRLKAAAAYQPNFRVKSKVVLVKPSHQSLVLEKEDYHLSELCDNLEVLTLDGNHVTILENPGVADVINRHTSMASEGYSPKESIFSDMKIIKQFIEGI